MSAVKTDSGCHITEKKTVDAARGEGVCAVVTLEVDAKRLSHVYSMLLACCHMIAKSKGERDIFFSSVEDIDETI